MQQDPNEPIEGVVIDGDAFNTQEAVRVIRKHVRRSVRRTLILVAIGAGVYYGTKRPFKQISKDVSKLTDNVDKIGKFMVARVDFEDARATNYRDLISAAINDGQEFTHYPGIGVLFHPIVEELGEAS